MENLGQEVLKKLKSKMSKNNELMLEKFCNIRTGVPNPQILDKIKIQYYDAETLLKNISIINVSQNNQISIKPFDSNLIPEIIKVLLNSNLGITPQNDGSIIRLTFPQPTEEKRKKLTKEIEKIAEQTKIAIRNIRRDGNEQIKKLKLNDFWEKFFLNQIQKLNNDWIKLIEDNTKNKNKELLKI
jgi:ribosome recycling factor